MSNLVNMISAGKRFPRIPYSEAITMLNKLGSPVPDKGLTKSHELLLVKEFNSPVFVTKFPSSLKPFYMKRDKDEKYVSQFSIVYHYVLG